MGRYKTLSDEKMDTWKRLLVMDENFNNVKELSFFADVKMRHGLIEILIFKISDHLISDPTTY